MRYILMMLIVGSILTGCSKSDRDLINGKWTIHSISTNGETLFTKDKAGQKKAVDRIVEKQMNMMASDARTPEQEEMLRKVYEGHMKELGKMTLEIKKDDSFIFNSYNGSSLQATNGTLQFDADKHILRLKSNVDEKFTYIVSSDELILEASEGDGSTKLTFRR